MGTVAFINTFYQPDYEETMHNERLQAEYHNYRNQIDVNETDSYWKMVRIQQMVEKLRDNIHVVSGT